MRISDKIKKGNKEGKTIVHHRLSPTIAESKASLGYCTIATVTKTVANAIKYVIKRER
jgi:hypothetical protein